MDSFSNGTNKGYADHNLYGYNPSRPAAYAFVALFGLAGLAHFISMFPYRAAFFIPLILGCAMECGGYYFRSLSSDEPNKILPFVINGLFILGASPMLAATIYMAFGRIVRALKGEKHSMISPKWLTALFVLADLACLVSQLAGSALRAGTDTESTGSTLVLGGLIFQAAIFCFFILLTWSFHVRFRRDDITGLHWGKYMVVLYTLSLIFIIRNIIRIVEFREPVDGFIVSHESMLYVFDGGFMLAIVLLLLFVHPGRLLRTARKAEKAGPWRVSNEMTPFVGS